MKSRLTRFQLDRMADGLADAVICSCKQNEAHRGKGKSSVFFTRRDLRRRWHA
jgi:hypothetical protein